MDNLIMAVDKATDLAIKCIPLLVIAAIITAVFFFAYNIYKETTEAHRLDRIYREALERKLEMLYEKDQKIINDSDDQANRTNNQQKNE